MINYNTIISNFNKRGTLLKWLKTLNEAVENGSLETVTTTTGTDYVIFHFVFADGTSVDSPAIPLEAGPKGDKGDPGTPGSPGQDGEAATIEVGTVTTLLPNQSATVTNVGTSSAAVFDFGIPKGDPGSATPTPIDNITDGTISTVSYSSGVATIEKAATVEYTDQSTDSITNTTLLPLSTDGGHLKIVANNGALKITDPITEQIVTVETTTIASRPYEVGEYFINSSDILVQATANIALGSTIDSTNSTPANKTLADELAKVNSLSNKFNAYQGSATSYESIEEGFWMLTSTQTAAMTDKPSVQYFAGGRSYVIKPNSTSLETGVIVISPIVSKCFIKFCYGTWGSWKEITLV